MRIVLIYDERSQQLHAPVISNPGPSARRSRTALLGALAALTAACGTDSTGPNVITDEPGTLTVNTTAGWVYVDLGATAQVVTVATPGTDASWDIAVNGTSVMLNGGAAGPGGVTGHCLCQNEMAADADVKLFTAASELADFTAVGAAQVPADASQFLADELTAAISGWYAYNPTTHAIAPAAPNGFYVRRANGTSFAKMRVTAIEGGSQARPDRVTLEYAVQPAAGAALGATQTATVDLTGGAPVHFSFANGVVDAGAEWDLKLAGWEIRVNGGASGSGQGGAIASSVPFASITDPGEAPASVYKADGFGGVFAAKRWYRYNITGSDHQVWPTFDVYLVKRGAEVFKVQLTGYYNAQGDPRNISFRWAKVSG